MNDYVWACIIILIFLGYELVDKWLDVKRANTAAGLIEAKVEAADKGIRLDKQ